MISDELWELIEPELPSHVGRRGRRWRSWKTAWKRHRRWSTDGTYQRIFERVLAEYGAAGKLDWLVSADSTIVRAHQHAAGAPSARSTGGEIE